MGNANSDTVITNHPLHPLDRLNPTGKHNLCCVISFLMRKCDVYQPQTNDARLPKELINFIFTQVLIVFSTGPFENIVGKNVHKIKFQKIFEDDNDRGIITIILDDYGNHYHE